MATTRKATPTKDDVRNTFIKELRNARGNYGEAFVNSMETELADFIREYVDANFPGVYDCLDHHFYDQVRNKIATTRKMSDWDRKSELRYSVYLRTYSNFLQSKAFKKLFNHIINIEGNAVPEAPAAVFSRRVPAPQFRDETEGERRHITRETDVIRRNPRLRQQCLDIYGYQCQCCGMDFAEMYGNELGANFIEVHHLKPISDFENDGVPENFLENLVPLCSNCHSMIHHISGSDHPLRDLRVAYKGVKKEIRKPKED